MVSRGHGFWGRDLSAPAYLLERSPRSPCRTPSSRRTESATPKPQFLARPQLDPAPPAKPQPHGGIPAPRQDLSAPTSGPPGPAPPDPPLPPPPRPDPSARAAGRMRSRGLGTRFTGRYKASARSASSAERHCFSWIWTSTDRGSGW